MTGADPALFDGMTTKATVVEVRSGRLTPNR